MLWVSVEELPNPTRRPPLRLVVLNQVSTENCWGATTQSGELTIEVLVPLSRRAASPVTTPLTARVTPEPTTPSRTPEVLMAFPADSPRRQ